MHATPLSPAERKALIGAVGYDLVGTKGKRTYYHPADVKRSADRCGYATDHHCWAQCFFTTPDDFRILHEATGEICDYTMMKTQLLTDIAGNSSFSPFDLDLSWLEWPDIDLSCLFDWFDIF